MSYMMSHSFERGDKVFLIADPERRAWTKVPYPDNEPAVVIEVLRVPIYRERTGHSKGRSVDRHNFRYQSGTYMVDGPIRVYVPRLELNLDLSGHEVQHADPVVLAEREARDKELAKQFGMDRGRDERIGDLPETKFWEGDLVRVTCKHPSYAADPVINVQSWLTPEAWEERKKLNPDPTVCVITRVGYSDINKTCNDGSPYPMYSISYKLGGGMCMSFTEAEIELVERGNIWKWYHDEPIEFGSLQEEANFAKLVSECEEVMNPKRKLYLWSLDEALQAIRDGIAHGFNTSTFSLVPISEGTPARIVVHRFNNEELGKRVAAATLEGFADYVPGTDATVAWAEEQQQRHDEMEAEFAKREEETNNG